MWITHANYASIQLINMSVLYIPHNENNGKKEDRSEGKEREIQRQMETEIKTDKLKRGRRDQHCDWENHRDH